MVYCDNKSKIISDAVVDNPTVVIKLQIRKPNCCKKYKNWNRTGTSKYRKGTMTIETRPTGGEKQLLE